MVGNDPADVVGLAPHVADPAVPTIRVFHGTRWPGPLAIRDGFAIHVGTVGCARARLRHTHNRAGGQVVHALDCAPRRVLQVHLDPGYWDDPYYILEGVTAHFALSNALRGRDAGPGLLDAFGIEAVKRADGTLLPAKEADSFWAFAAMRDLQSDCLPGAPLRGPKIAPGSYARDHELNARLRTGLRRLGFDAIAYQNGFEARGSMSYAILDARVLTPVSSSRRVGARWVHLAGSSGVEPGER